MRPCESGPGESDRPPVERAEYAVFPVHHVAACCAIGAVAWAGLIAAGRIALDVVVQFV